MAYQYTKRVKEEPLYNHLLIVLPWAILVPAVSLTDASLDIAMITESTNATLSAPTEQAGLLPTENSKAIRIAEWLLPVQELEAVSSQFFGRNIPANIQRIKNKRRPLGLKLRNRLAVIIIDNESYEELLSLKATYIELIEQMTQSDED